MLQPPLSNKEKLERGVALKGIATTAQDMADKGATPLEVQTFAQGAKRELARELADTGRMGEAVRAAKIYKELNKT